MVRNRWEAHDEQRTVGVDNRIALFSASLRGGGAERVMVNLAHGFVERGLTVDLVLASAEGPYLSQVPPRANIIDLRASRTVLSLPGLVRYLRERQPRALISAMSHINLLALWAKSLSGVSTRIIASVHNQLSYSSAPKGRRLALRALPYLMRRCYPQAERVVAVSHCVADELIKTIKLPRDKIAVIYNPVVTPELFEKAKQPAQHAWFAQPRPPVILSVGRLTEQKDYSTLIRAFAEFRQRHAARLMILGEGEQRPILEELVKALGVERDVALPGFVGNPYAFMSKAAVFVLSSRWEGLPTVLIEALALGMTVISTNCKCGPAEILDGGRYGQLVPVGDSKALAEAIEQALFHPRDKLSNNSWAAFGLNAAVEQYMNLACAGAHA